MGTCVSFSRLFSAENKTEPPTLESSWRAQYFFSVVRGCKNPLGKADLLENHLWSVLCQRVWYVNWHKHRMNPSRAYTELLHFPQRDVAESADPKVLFHSDLRSQLICRLLITAEKGASENKTYFHEKKKKKPFTHVLCSQRKYLPPSNSSMSEHVSSEAEDSLKNERKNMCH